MEQQQPPITQGESLDSRDTANSDGTNVTPEPGGLTAPTGGGTPPLAQPGRGGLFGRAQRLVSRVNLYLLAFILLVILTGIGLYIFNSVRNQPAEKTNDKSNNTLTEDALKQLNNSDVKIGDPKAVLGIESNTIFAGKVLIRDTLDVAGSLKLGGSLTVPGLTVAGVSNFDQIQTNGLSVSGNFAAQGAATFQKSLSVAGGGSFGGPVTAPQITVDTLQLNRDLQITHHIDAGGGTPGKSDGTALGSGGTSSVSGTDTAGTVAINTGGGPPVGCFITVNFAQRFNSTPHVSLTPASPAAATLSYYVSRNTASFTVCTASAPVAGQNYTFDYIVID